MASAAIEPLSLEPRSCASCPVRNGGICSILSPREIWVLNKVARRRQLAPGETLVCEGGTPVVGNVVSGMLVERKGLADGREQILALLFPTDFIGTSQAREATVTLEAVAETTICSFDRHQFDHFADEMPHLQTAVLAFAKAELDRTREWMLLLGQKTASEKVATFLLRLAERASESRCAHEAVAPVRGSLDGTQFDIPITRAQIASYLGLTIETVSRKLTDLRNSGTIELTAMRAVRVCKDAQLRAAAG